MTFPRRVLPGALYMISRRCSERRFFLRPDATVRAITEYVVAMCAERYGIELLAVCVLSNHYHLVLHDPHGLLPNFMRDVDQLIARALNAHYGRGENFWAPGSYNSVEIPDEETLLEKLLYVWTNPVKDGLVERPEQWPGLMTLPEDMGRSRRTRARPTTAFFGGKRPPDWVPTYESRRHRLARYTGRNRGRRAEQPRRAAYRELPSTLPEFATLTLHVPPSEQGNAESFRVRAAEALQARLQEIHQARRAAGLHGYLGAEAVRSQDPHDSAGGTAPEFALDPDLAPGSDTEERVDRIEELQEWRAQYQAVLSLWRRGRRRGRFPPGTWYMAQLHGAPVAGRATAEAA